MLFYPVAADADCAGDLAQAQAWVAAVDLARDLSNLGVLQVLRPQRLLRGVEQGVAAMQRDDQRLNLLLADGPVCANPI